MATDSSRQDPIAMKPYTVTSSHPVQNSSGSIQGYRDTRSSECTENNRPTSSLLSPTQPDEQHARAFKEWRPLLLVPWVNALLLLAEVSIVTTLFVIWALSRSRNGAFEVPQKLGPFGIWDNAAKYYSLLWTSFPVLILSLYAFGWAALVQASAGMSPYIELIRGGRARVTIMLDYAALPLWKVWYIAGQHGHYHLTAGFLLQTALAGFLVPFSAHLLVQRSVFTSNARQINVVSSFSEDLSYIDGTTNLQPVIGLATAIQVYNSTPPMWMTDSFAFEKTNFRATDGNLTAPLLTYFADLQCVVVDSDSHEIQQDSAQVFLSFTDRGCLVQQSFRINPNISVHAFAWQQSCSNDGSSRMGTFVADQDASDTSRVGNLRISSCIPTYWQINATLTLAYDSNGTPSFYAVRPSEGSAISMFPALRFALEQNVMFYSQQSLSNAIDSNAVGLTVYSVAQGQDSNTSPTVTALLDSLKRTYGTIFAATMNSMVLIPSDVSRTVSATFTTSSSRLFTVDWVVWAEVALFTMIITCHVWVYVHSRIHHTMLDEEAYGLLGKAKLLRRSNLFDVVDAFEESHPNVNSMQKHMKEHHYWSDDRCYWDDETRRVIVDRFHQ